ncbi:MAG: stage II sporulation protein R [Clostridia bacterium]
MDSKKEKNNQKGITNKVQLNINKKHLGIKNSKICPTFFIFIFCFIVLNTYIVLNIYSKSIQKNKILRLHVVANSNTQKDQLVKQKIAAKVDTYINNIKYNKNTTNTLTKIELLEQSKKRSNEILAIANTTLAEEKVEYTSKINIGKILYDKKESVNIDMEAGTYDSIQIVLGKGEGKNFWSLIFPNEQDIEDLQNLDTVFPGISNIYNNSKFTNQNAQYEFKLLELLKKI